MTFIILKKCILILLLTVYAVGQDSLLTEPLALSRVQAGYENLKYSQVVNLVKSELEARPQQPLPRLEILLKYMALAQASLGQEAEARGTMASLVLINPNFQFQPGEVSPKIQDVFNQVRKQYIHSPALASNQAAYLIKTDRRAELILKSISFPGWGQLAAGRQRGYFWAAAFSATVIGSGIAAYMTQQTHADYLKAYDPATIQDRYNTYNRWFRWRNSFLTLTLMTYTGNLLDISFLSH